MSRAKAIGAPTHTDRILLPETNKLVWLFFRFSGRVNRAAYFLAGLLLAVVQAFLLYRFMLVAEDSPAGQGWAVAFWIVMIVAIVSPVAGTTRDAHFRSIFEKLHTNAGGFL